ncbi:MAG: hypothetical protein OEU50_05440 [Gammaproteobacteria bacterium]|nr:hypothetical protein [Gammaproteobacteria bacterium]
MRAQSLARMGIIDRQLQQQGLYRPGYCFSPVEDIIPSSRADYISSGDEKAPCPALRNRRHLSG